MKSGISLLLLMSLILFGSFFTGCDYTDYGSEPIPKEDGDDEVPPLNPPVDRDIEEEQVAFTGATLENPYEITSPGLTNQADDITTFGSTITAAGCAETAPATKMRVVVDGDDEVAEVEVEVEIEVELEAEIEAEQDTTDGDLDDELIESDTEVAEVEVEAEQDTTTTDGDIDEEVAADVPEIEEEEEEAVVDYGNGPELVFKVALSQGDELKATWEGESFDGLIYMLAGNTAGAQCSGLVDNVDGFGKESFSYVAVGDMTVYLVLDTKTGATGAGLFTIELIAAQSGNPPADGKIGAACGEDEECESAYCLTSDVLFTLLQTSIDIPNGYCSNLGLFGGDCKASACNDETGGICLDGGFMGPSYENMVKICVRPCETNGDCRIEDSNVCVDPQEWVDEGLLSSADKEEYFQENKFCLPSAFVEVMEGELRLQ